MGWHASGCVRARGGRPTKGGKPRGACSGAGTESRRAEVCENVTFGAEQLGAAAGGGGPAPPAAGGRASGRRCRRGRRLHCPPGSAPAP